MIPIGNLVLLFLPFYGDYDIGLVTDHGFDKRRPYRVQWDSGARTWPRIEYLIDIGPIFFQRDPNDY